MNRLIYLFELDSAKAGRNDAEFAEYAIFREIIKNGNKVVLSMNQFVDSRVIASAMYDEENYKYVKRLFEDGALKVSLYADVCSVSQYVQNAINKCLNKGREGYIFNALPVSANDRDMLLEVKHSLQYSDISNFNKMLDAEYLRLRYEDNLEIRGTILENIRTYKVIIRFLSLVLKLSVNVKGNNPPKAAEGRGFLDFMNVARSTLKKCSFRRRDINYHKLAVLDKLNAALDFFESEEMTEKQMNRRSNWIKFIMQSGKRDTATELAEEIINICYNYAVQDTILGVSKQYNDENFTETFRTDFIRRVNYHWVLRSRLAVERSHDEENDLRLCYPMEWKRAASLSFYNAEYPTVEMVTPVDSRPERMTWYKFIFKRFGTTLGLAAAYVFAFCALGFIIDFAVGAAGTTFIGLFLSNFISMLLVTVASVILSLLTRWPNAIECAIGVFNNARNLVNAITRKYDFRAKK